MKGKLFTKLVSVAIALAMLLSLAAVSLAESGDEEPEVKIFIVSFNMERYIKYVETEDGTPVKKPETKPEREGYVFSYWFVKGDIYQEPYDFSLPVTGALMLEPLYLLQAPGVDPADEGGEDDINKEEPEDTEGDPADTPPPSDDPPADPDPDDPDPQDDGPADPAAGDPAGDAHDEDIEDDEEETVDEEFDDEDEDEDDEETVDEDEGIDDDEEEPEAPARPERSIRIWTDAPDEVQEGTSITLQSELTGYEDCILSLRWQYSTDEGITWQDAVGGTGYTYTYAASVELSKCLWHLCVNVLEEPLL